MWPDKAREEHANLLNRHRIKGTPNELLLCSLIGAFLNPRQRSFFVQYLGINTPTTGQDAENNQH